MSHQIIRLQKHSEKNPTYLIKLLGAAVYDDLVEKYKVYADYFDYDTQEWMILPHIYDSLESMAKSNNKIIKEFCKRTLMQIAKDTAVETQIIKNRFPINMRGWFVKKFIDNHHSLILIITLAKYNEYRRFIDNDVFLKGLDNHGFIEYIFDDIKNLSYNPRNFKIQQDAISTIDFLYKMFNEERTEYLKS
jgi:hypothetical protein